MKDSVRATYGAAARQAVDGRSCCDCGCGGGALYDEEQLAGLPAGAVAASLGCGNPAAQAEVIPGEVVLDLGSGGGLDALLMARRVGPEGRVYGLDFTGEMLDLARSDQLKAGVKNAEFLKGDIEAIPLPDASVDLVISNCVINLAVDKDRVFQEIFRTLRARGRLVVSDTVLRGDVSQLPGEFRGDAAAWTACAAGALEERDYVSRLEAAGFTDISLEVTAVYGDVGLPSREADEARGGIALASALVRARKPGAGGFAIRQAVSGDLPAVQRLLGEAGLPPASIEGQCVEGFAVAVTTADAAPAGRVVGVAGIEAYGKDGLLRSVAVDAAWRARGVGRALVEERVAWARRRRLGSLWLLTSGAQGYFVRHGFAVRPRSEAPAEMRDSEEFARACPASAIAMSFLLGG